MVNRLLILAGFLGSLFIGLSVIILQLQLPKFSDFSVLFSNTDNIDVLLLQSYTLPRITIAILAGGTLGFASLLLQQVTSNALASDNTLGISSGAQFSLFLCAIFMPQWLEKGSSLIAALGATLSLILVVILAWRQSISPLLLVLAGLVVNLYFGSFSTIMILFYPEESRGLAQWGAGSLVQESWRDSLWLLAQTLPISLIVILLARPLSILSLNDNNAKSLGVPVNFLRIIIVVIAAYLISAVVSHVGMHGFIGLAAATIIRQCSVRHFINQLLSAFLIGALLLSVTDLFLQLIGYFYNLHLPTGAMTSLLGTPLLLWLMFGNLSKVRQLPPSPVEFKIPDKPIWKKVVVLLLFLCGTLIISLCVGKINGQWQWLSLTENNYPLLELRYPRIITAFSTGILLAISGVILQQLTQNPMSSPELLGISSGTSMGILAALFLFSFVNSTALWAAGIIGAILALLMITTINQRNGMLPEKVLLTGITLAALFDTLQRIAISSGDPRANLLISWSAGSTQQANLIFALPLLILSVGLLLVSLLFSRWLILFNLQAPIAQSLGLNLKLSRFILILFSALLSAIATLIIGPLSFIGLLVPHLSRFLGIRQIHSQLIVSALLGAFIMVLADWFGRQIIAPYEIPAGLVATVLGGTYFLVTIRKL
ncbi:Fe(3+)-hydroxamate ABC transporter permease FhuB [Rodentibacter caecimuris]|uniref:Fe3+-hydroxamate ABC transporter permease FhuB n=1 Tax=Rodentibacter caecimuris TaxID=1796644 RepID=A0ABX3KX14_9PAST|nr:Fe3+-hydroxamate ABC transporter permease FhuB [Rodentibacter heylii]